MAAILAARDRIGQAAGRSVVDLARPADAGGLVGEAVGDFASRARAKFEAEQGRLRGAVREASETMAGRFKPQDLWPVDAGGRLGEATRRAADEGRAGYRQAYSDTFAKEGQVAPEFFSGLAKPGTNGMMAPGSSLDDFAAPISRRISEALVNRAEPLIPDATITPVASRKLAELDRIADLNLGRIGNPRAGETISGDNLRSMEQGRKIITARYRSAQAER